MVACKGLGIGPHRKAGDRLQEAAESLSDREEAFHTSSTAKKKEEDPHSLWYEGPKIVDPASNLVAWSCWPQARLAEMTVGDANRCQSTLVRQRHMNARIRL